MKIPRNDRRTGFIIGLVLPALVFFFFFEATKASLNFEEFVGFLDTFQVLTSVIALSTLVNLAVFWGALKRKYDQTARGIIFATLIITVGVALYKIP